MASPTIIDTPTTYASQSAESSSTFSHTVQSTGGNRALIVIARSESGNNTAFSSCTWNGVAMTQIVSVVGSETNGGIMFYLANPDTGTHDVVLTKSSGSSENDAIAFALQDCAQSSPVDVTSGNITASSGTSASGNVTTTVNDDIVIAWCTAGNASSSMSATTGTQIASFEGATGKETAAAWIEKATAGLQSMSFSWTTSAPYDMFITSLKYDQYIAPTGQYMAMNKYW